MNAHSFAPPDGRASAPADADGFFAGSGHVRILRHLEQAIAQDDRLVVLTGDDGVGKSTVLQRLLHGFDRSAVWPVLLTATHLGTGKLAGSLAQAFGAPGGEGSPAALHAALLRHLASHANGRTALAAIDDAHGLPPEAIAELGELTREGPLRVLLVGHPALRLILQRQLPLQPASLSCHLEPLAENETPAYIEHHLRRVGWNGAPEFSAEAQALIHRFSRGVPRRIDRLCDRLLRAARLREEPIVAADAVRRIARPRLDDDTIPMLTSAVDEVPSGWAASTDLPPDADMPHWARTAPPPGAPARAVPRDDARVAMQRRRISLALIASVFAAALAFWLYRSFEPLRVDASMTTTPTPAAADTAAPAPQPMSPSPVPSPAPSAMPTEAPRPALAARRAAAPAAPPSRTGSPIAPPSPVPGPCTATVAALGLCTPTENTP